MAGLLDSDLMQFLVTPRAFMARRNAAADAERFQGLLGEYQTQRAAQAGAQPGTGGLLDDSAPGAAFWLQAAQIPGYQAMANQQLGYGAAGSQAMARQLQQQQYEAGNMTLAQRLQAEARQRADAFAEQIGLSDLQRKWYGTQASAAASGASAGASNASQMLTMAKLEEQRGKNAKVQMPLYNRLTPDQQVKANSEMSNADSWASSARDVADWAQNRGSGAALPVVGTAAADAMNLEWQTSVKPAMMQWLNTGVLQSGEREQLEEIMGAPADKVLTKSQLNTIATISQKVEDYRGQVYENYGLQASPGKLGQSAVARTLSKAQPVGEVQEVQSLPAPSRGWRPEQEGLIGRPALQRFGR